MKNKRIKNIVLFLLTVIFLVAIGVSGYFFYQYMFPTNKELLILANINTYKASQQNEKPVTFTKDTTISFETEGDFTNKDAAKAFDTFEISLHNVKKNENTRLYDVSIDFLGNDFLDSKAVKIGDTDVFGVPQLAETSYAADSYSDVLSLLLGSEKPQKIDYLNNVDKEGFKRYYGKYLQQLYENIPDNDFSLTENDNVKTLILKSDLNRLLYDILTDIKSNKELRDFSYEQKKIIYDNVNKKIPYAGTLLTIENKDEYDEKFAEDIDKLIKDIENSTVTVIAEIDKDRRIIKETIKVETDKETQLFVLYSDDNIEIINNSEGKLKFNLVINTKSENEKTYQNLKATFDINDFTKEKSQEQKLLAVVSETITDTAPVSEIEFPEEFTDIRNMAEEEREKITQTASKKFMEMVALLMLELI